MRLNCPNCGTGYDVPDGMVPAAGRHVQCTDCHTRWFVRGAARPMLSEEQIISRLEARSRPRPVPVPDPAPDAPEPATQWSADDLAGAFEWEDAEAIGDEAPRAAEPEPAPAAAATAPAPPSPWKQPQPSPPASADAVVAPPPRRAARIDLTSEGAPVPPPRAAPRSRFALGLGLVLGVFAVMLAAYRAHEPIAAQIPAAAPALEAYVGAIDAVRADLSDRLGAGGDG